MLLKILLLLLLIAYICTLLIIYKDKKYFLLSPLFSFNLTLVLSCAGFFFFDHFISEKTFAIFSVYSILFNISYLAFDKNVEKRRIVSDKIVLPRYLIFCLLIMQLFSLVAAVEYMKSVIRTNGLYVISSIADYANANFSAMRRNIATGKFAISITYKLMNQFNIFNIINPILFIHKYRRMGSKKDSIILLISLLCGAAYSFIFLQRAYIFLIFIISAYSLLLNTKSISRKILKKIILGIVVLVLLFSFITNVRLQKELKTSENVFKSILTRYVLGITGLNAFVSGYDGHEATMLEDQVNYISYTGFSWSDIEFGKNTFKTLTRLLYGVTGKSVFKISRNYEYIHYPVDSNIYTFLRPIFQDFYYLGIVVFSLYIGFIFSKMYNSFFYKNSVIGSFIIGYINYMMIRFTEGFLFDLKIIVLSSIILYLFKKKYSREL